MGLEHARLPTLDLVAAHHQNRHQVHAVAVGALGRGPADAVAGVDAKRVGLDEPGPLALEGRRDTCQAQQQGRPRRRGHHLLRQRHIPALDAAVQRVVVQRLPVGAVGLQREGVAVGDKAAMAAEAVAPAVAQIAVGRQVVPAGAQGVELVGSHAQHAQGGGRQHGLALALQAADNVGGVGPGRFEHGSGAGVLVRLGRERVGVELLGRQAALRDKVLLRRVHHDGRAAGIDLVAGEVRQIRHHRAVHEAGAARPAFIRLGKHRHIAQRGPLGGGLGGPGVQVEVGLLAGAPVQHHRPGRADVAGSLDDGLDRRKAGAAGQQNDGLGRVLAQEEAAEGAFHAQDVLLLERVEDMVGEPAAGHVADVQLDLAGLAVRRIGHRIAAAGAVAQDELDILASAELEILVGRQLQAQHGHVGGRLVDRDDAGGQLEHRELASAGHRARLDDAVGLGAGAAGQHEAGGFLLGAQGLGLVVAVHDAAVEQLALAGAAGAVLAAVGQAHALADGGGEQGVVAFGGVGAAGGLDRDLVGHGRAEKQRPRWRVRGRRLRRILPYP
mmetsp:Transcript_41205/g.96295  ORF Transcript_41205/g.96295 Transcript_41205/m.96295 type:complete len:555 (-) Transcript_41205:257-1921(-)